MSETVLIAETGRATGSAASRRLRAEDKIPAVVYGHGMEPISIAVGRRDLRLAVSGPAGMNTVLDLTVDGAVYPTLIKHVDRHPVRRSIQHIDFIQVNLNEEITVAVPIHLVGEAKAVQQNNGLVDPAIDQLEVVTTPRNIPDSITIDITDMTMDTVIRVSDLELPAGVIAVADPETPVVTVLVMRAAAVETESDAADGETPAAGESASDEPAADDDA
jgi:large subunit ribosomal protein L25